MHWQGIDLQGSQKWRITASRGLLPLVVKSGPFFARGWMGALQDCGAKRDSVRGPMQVRDRDESCT